ncbi:hypothetical protein DFP72DRAFT_1064335 [Ephemerocybe angulata]|uniref:Uncharacterized protein n=1 Tax=Ephemerocybe angulata TaxID=980116 RepID=A0A8H6I6J0_9AGAR|nr:hypothetical protein DFP72DRAFT_1064335 [Tulosesus angulatus]
MTRASKKKTEAAAALEEAPATAAPKRKNLDWVTNTKWTDTLITYLTTHPIFRAKLFSDSNADAAKEGRSKAVGKDSKNKHYGTLAEHIFANDVNEKAGFALKPTRYATSVETRLRRLKTDYQGHVKDLKQTGAGIAREDITPGSELESLRKKVDKVFPWFDDLHAFWKDLPNYNPIDVTTSTPGASHAENAAAAFEPPSKVNDEVDDEVKSDSEDEDGKEDEVQDDDEEEGSDEVSSDEEKEKVTKRKSKGSDKKTIKDTKPAAKDTKPAVKDTKPDVTKRKSKGSDKKTIKDTKPAAKDTKPAVKDTKPDVKKGGRDLGLSKGSAAQANKSNQRQSVDKVHEFRAQQSDRMARKREMDHELAMEKAKAKRMKYEFKQKQAELESLARMQEAREREARDRELKLQIEMLANRVSNVAGGNQPGAGLGFGAMAMAPASSSTSFIIDHRSSSPDLSGQDLTLYDGNMGGYRSMGME